MILLASDFDNTIYLEDDIEATNRNINKIKDFMSKGNSFCIITGRNYTDLKALLNKYNIPYTYLICEDGAKIFNYVDYCLDTINLDKEEIEKVIPILEENKCDYYLDDGYNETTNYNDCVKIVVKEKNKDKANELIKKIKDKVDIHIYASRVHINIIHKSVNKRNALKKLFNLEELDYNNLRVIGDNDNDYEMLKEFEGGVIKEHHKILDELHKDEYETLADYIDYLGGR